MLASSGTGVEPLLRPWSLPRLSFGLAVMDVLILVTAFVWTALNIESYTLDLRFPDPARLLIWCAVLAGIWLPIAINNQAYHSGVLGHGLRSPYVIAKTTIIAGALFHIVPLVGGP